MGNFSFYHTVFYPLGESAIFIKSKIVVCKVLEFGKVENLSFGKGVNVAEELLFCKRVHVVSKVRVGKEAFSLALVKILDCSISSVVFIIEPKIFQLRTYT